jgi:heme exporter protein A
MNNFKIELKQVTKYFGRLLVFKDIDYSFASGAVNGITGRNGSGKSTLTKIISGLNSASKGKIEYRLNDLQIESENLFSHIGFVAPYLVLYGEFSAIENLQHFAKIRGIEFNHERAKFLLDEFNLYKRRNDLLKGFSSGMLQRMKFIFALQHEPEILFLDEPTSNLDSAGKDKVYEIIENSGKEKLVVVASNDQTDLDLCSNYLNVEQFKRVK